MKKILSVIAILLIGFNCFAQEKSSLSKEEKKALKKAEKEQHEKMLMANTSQAIASGNYVFKADRASTSTGQSLIVNPIINFILVTGKTAYVQTGSDSGVGGNGVGGLTLKGEITSYGVKSNERTGGYVIRFNVEGSSTSLSILMNVNATGEMSTATISHNTGGTLNFSGILVPSTGSNLTKGAETR